MEGRYLGKTCTWTMNNQEIPTHVLINCAATGITFNNQDIACHHQIALRAFKQKHHVEVIDGRPIESGYVTHLAQVEMAIQDHKLEIPMFDTQLGHYPIVLGAPQLWIPDAVQFVSNTPFFRSQYCTMHCDQSPVMIQRVTEKPPKPIHIATEALFEPKVQPQRPLWGNIAFLNGSTILWTVKKGMMTIIHALL